MSEGGCRRLEELPMLRSGTPVPLEKILLAEYYHRRSLCHEDRKEAELSMLWARR
jgi:hypothetical protein